MDAKWCLKQICISQPSKIKSEYADNSICMIDTVYWVSLQTIVFVMWLKYYLLWFDFNTVLFLNFIVFVNLTLENHSEAQPNSLVVNWVSLHIEFFGVKVWILT